MAEAFAKFRVGTPGAGASHATYITRASALEPDKQQSRGAESDPNRDENTVESTLADHLNDRSIAGQAAQDADAVWTWNAPVFLTGDTYGSAEPRASPVAADVTERDRLLTEKMMARVNSSNARRRLKEKIANVRAYFGSKEEFEKAKGGRTHYRVILSFDVPATNSQIRELTNQFLKETFPKAIAFGAIHRDTEHPHAHLYLHARQIDGKKIYLSRQEYASIDEKWAKIYSEFAGERGVYIEHLRKKEQTKQWKMAAAAAYRKGEPIPPKPERDNDRRERLAEQRLSAQRSQARDRGRQLNARPVAEPVMRPGSEKETSRLLAKEEVAREELAHLIRTDAPAGRVKWAAKTAHGYAVALEKTLAARTQMGKEKLPQVVYTTEEWKQLKEYARSRDVAVRDDQTAARLQSARVIAGAELKDAQTKAEAFEGSRHFWKVDVHGWGRMSLREVEAKIKHHTEEKFKLRNFLRPTKRESIQRTVDYFQEIKKDIQKQLVTAGHNINKNVGAAQLKYEIASKLVAHAEKARASQGKAMPSPVFDQAELRNMVEMANRNKDAHLLAYVYSQVKNSLLENPDSGSLSSVKGKAVMARMEMMKQGDRHKAAIEFGDFRQLPLRDSAGYDYTKSLREVEPRSALEFIIRHFTDTAEQKRERQAAADVAADQVRRAETQSLKARDWSVVRDRIAADFYRAAGVRESQVEPALTHDQIAELKEYAETLPYFSISRKEFSEEARMAEQGLQRREAQAERDAQQLRTRELTGRHTLEQSRSDPSTTRNDRTEGGSFRGR
jgi:di/tripeptidase